MSDLLTSGQPVAKAADESGPQVDAALAGDLKAAIRRQRIADAERSGAIYDLRGAELARLEVLDEALAPVYGGLPKEIDLFDHGIVPSERPRLYVDIVAFVEMARDGRSYRFLLDTHEGRIALGESADTAVIKQLVVDHIARRLLAREKALASTAYPTGMLAGAQQGWPARRPSEAEAMAAVLATGITSVKPVGSLQRFPALGLLLFVLGLAAGAGMLFAWLRNRSVL